ncbi:RING finger protein 151-like [Mucor ambiguus]|uniref:RING finger protein 151-like n=1 Tax=Mucor ambiguus TaxID=91626 RepID=A0A0C9M4S4_9FUNG|nr:RING finger protein 151-like [Mucor ambiguus]
MKKVDLLLDEPCPELLCGICSDILEDPMQVHCPEDHMFCSKCITCHVEQQSNCPICTMPLDKNTFQVSKFVTRQVGRLRIKCAYSDTGCPWQGLLSDQHISECEYQPCTCPNADKGCNVTNLNKSNMQHHLKSCLYQTMTCPNNMPLCQPFLLLDLSKHESQCQSYTCPYANEGCPFIGTLTQVNIHCEGYCGRLHQKVNQLEEEVKRLNKLIQDVTIGLNIKLPSTPETALQEDESKKQQQQQQVDTSMDEMALFHQMFNSDPFGALDLSATTPTAMDQNTPNHHEDDNTSMMDLGSVLPDINFLDLNQPGTRVTSSPSHSSSSASNFHNNINNNNNNDNNHNNITLNNNNSNQQVDFNSIFETATSPQPLQFVPPVNVPKRTSNGKKIRYSKNVRLAHNALRIARQRTASNNNPSNDAILNNLDIAKQQMNNGNQITFKNFQDVAHFLNTDAMPPSSNTTTTTSNKKPTKTVPAVSSSMSSSSTTTTTNTPNTATAKPTPKKEKKKNITVSSPQYTDPTVSSPPPSTNAPKRRPMFILASSYLSNYNSNNEKV